MHTPHVTTAPSLLQIKILELCVLSECSDFYIGCFRVVLHCSTSFPLPLHTDKCLESLFKSGKVLSHALSCLEAPSSSLQQRANAALLLANMARSEENCRVLVEKGAVPLLVALTKMEESKEVCVCVCVCVHVHVHVHVCIRMIHVRICCSCR